MTAVKKSNPGSFRRSKLRWRTQPGKSVLFWFGGHLYGAFLVCFVEITLMESDILSDDFVETETFDLGTLEINKTCAKTFTFREVKLLVFVSRHAGFSVIVIQS